ncbi:MAG: FAD-binding domain-containing protein, partial [Armatimonadota bacterium]
MDFPELPIDPPDRDSLLAELIAHRSALPSTGHALSPWIGGRAEGLRRLSAFATSGYAGGRSRVGDDTGASTLGPWIRHGLITLGECRDHALRSGGRHIPVKFLQELAWREYFQRVRADRGDPALWTDLEPPKVALGDDPLPDDIRFGRTGLACIDDNIERLRTTGYVVNQARMWLASYVVHHRRVRWQEGAAWFLQHLLDGDPASNNLSWQWVASTYSHQPYL